MAKSLRRWRLDGPHPIRMLLTLSLTSSRHLQGGGVLAAFTSFFPDLVDSKVALIATTGLVEVSSSIIGTSSSRPQIY